MARPQFWFREGRMVNTDHLMAEVVNVEDSTGKTVDGKIVWWGHTSEFVFRPNSHEVYGVDDLEEVVAHMKDMNARDRSVGDG